MAEWLGHMMSSWPTWLVVIGVIVITVVGLFIFLLYSGAELPTWRRKRK